MYIIIAWDCGIPYPINSKGQGDARRIIIQRWKMEPDYFEACYKSMHKKGAQ